MSHDPQVRSPAEEHRHATHDGQTDEEAEEQRHVARRRFLAYGLFRAGQPERIRGAGDRDR
jgi:hypothetical protein